jgi:hypothetical protein
MTTLATALDEVRRRIRRIGQTSVNEENIKAALIEPLLRARTCRSGVIWRSTPRACRGWRSTGG